MKIAHENYDQISVISVKGDLIADQTDLFRKEALARFDENVRDFVIDVSGMEFIDSKGLETLLWLQDTAGERLGQIRLAAPPENVSKILEITRLAARLDAHPDVDAAIKSLR